MSAERVVRYCPLHNLELVDGTLTCPKGHTQLRFGVLEKWRFNSTKPRAIGIASAEGGDRGKPGPVALEEWHSPPPEAA